MDFKRLGPYQIGRQIGRGGMGTVFSAIEVETGKQAAVKVLSPALAEREGFRDRFEAEIESLKQLEHPNIVKLFGYGRQDHYLFYAMELIDGPTLEDELRANRRFNWREVAEIGIMLCRALKLAHDHGIVHRDIKPANLLVTREGNVKLSDFGIARLFGNMNLTSEGGVIGTAEYMAPEQADGRRVTHHCDLYSLGCVLYALLAGRPPFKAATMVEMLHMQRYAEPESVRRFAHDTPKEFDSIIMQLLSKEPSDRFPNALMVARRLESMERALSRPVQRDPEAGDMGETAYEELPPGASDVALDVAGEDISTIKSKLQQDVTSATRTSDDPLAVDSDADEPHRRITSLAATGDSNDDGGATSFEVGYSPRIFTSIEEERQRALERERAEQPLVSLPTILLGAALIAIGGIVWYLLQPASADSLYQDISAAAESENPAALTEVEAELDEFLSHYRGHEKAEEVRDLQDRLTRYRLARNASQRARRLIQRYPQNSAGRAYMEAINLAEYDPVRAIVKLESLVTLFGALPDDAFEDKEQLRANQVIVQEASDQLIRLRTEMEAYATAQRDLLQESLDYADSIEAENAAQADSIRRAAINLYEGKPWAEELVLRARESLGEEGNRGVSKTP